MDDEVDIESNKHETQIIMMSVPPGRCLAKAGDITAALINAFDDKPNCNSANSPGLISFRI